MTTPTDLRLCKFPGCTRPVEPTTGAPGRPVEYCDDPEHTAVRAWRLRQGASGSANAVQEDLGRPVSMATVRASVLRDDVARALQQLQDLISRTLDNLHDMSDPDAAAAQMETISAEAAAQVAAAEVAQRHAEVSAREATKGARLADQAATEIEQQLTQALAERDEAENARDEEASALAVAEGEVASTREQLTAAIGEKEGLELRVRDLEASLATLDANLRAETGRADTVAAQAEKERRQAAKDAAQTEAALNTALARTKSAEGELTEMRGCLEDARVSTSRLELELAVATQRADDAASQIERVEAARSAADSARLEAEKAAVRAESQLEHVEARLGELQEGRGKTGPAS